MSGAPVWALRGDSDALAASLRGIAIEHRRKSKALVFVRIDTALDMIAQLESDAAGPAIFRPGMFRYPT